MNWKKYLNSEFPSALECIAHAHPDTSDCIDHPHCCQAPQERRVLLNPEQVQALEPECACVWYGLTLIEQGLFRYFPELVDAWLVYYPFLKLPVRGSGVGCVEVMPPNSLVVSAAARRTFPSFLKFYSQELNALLAPSGLNVKSFIDAIEQDQAFHAGREGSCDAQLMQAVAALEQGVQDQLSIKFEN